ncbi:hypothetical protein D3C87_1479460 [compost metagenome]
MVNRQVSPFFKCNAIQLCGRIKYTVFKDIAELKIRFDLVLVQVIFCFTYLFGIMVPVVWRQFKTALLPVY